MRSFKIYYYNDILIVLYQWRNRRRDSSTLVSGDDTSVMTAVALRSLSRCSFFRTQTVADLGGLRWHTKQRIFLGLLAEVLAHYAEDHITSTPTHKDVHIVAQHSEHGGRSLC